MNKYLIRATLKSKDGTVTKQYEVLAEKEDDCKAIIYQGDEDCQLMDQCEIEIKSIVLRGQVFSMGEILSSELV